MTGQKILVALATLILTSVAIGDTHVSGDLTTAVWTLEGSPYILDDDVTLLNNNSLIVEAGVEIRSESFATFFNNGDLLSQGTAENPVLFTAIDPFLGWGGFFIDDNDEPTIMHHTIIECGRVVEPDQIHGGGIVVRHSSVELYDCEIRHNESSHSAGGIYLYYADYVIVRTHIHHNYATHYAAAVDFAGGDGGVFHHNILSYNHSNTKASILFYDGHHELDHITFVNNTAGDGATDFWATGGSGSITNSIIWNTISEFPLSDNDGVEAFYCCVSDNSLPGENQFSEDPMFIDIDNMDFHLLPLSPCIDAGDPASEPDPDYTITDVGAFYFDQETPIPPIDPVFTQHIVGEDFPGARDVHAADLDSDGDMDIMGASYNGHEIAWWENTGGQNFTEYTIASNFSGAHSVYSIDMDQDGDIDVLGAAYQGDRITWWENDGNENFTEHDVDGFFNGAASVYATDLDSDGDVDVLGAAKIDDEIAWWENDGNQNWTRHTVSDVFDGAFSVYVTDMDADGDLDILGAASIANAITWWENDGNQNWTGHTIAGYFYGAQCAYAADMDGDGDIDVAGAAFNGNNGLKWWENDGNQNFTSHAAFGDFPYSRSVHVEDMDNDGDMDLLATAAISGEYAWWENDGNQPPTFTKWLIADNIYGPNSVYAEDIDGDGDVDVLGTGFYADAIYWWESYEAPLVVTAAPLVDPLIIPADGGNFGWDVMIENISESAYQYDAWTEVILPNGNPYGPLVLFEGLTLQPGQVLEATPIQSVPFYAPGGSYTYVAKVGDYPDAVASDGFEFEKLAAADAAGQGFGDMADWAVTGWFEDESEEIIPTAVMPAEFGIDNIYPNPFNPATTISVALPKAADLQVRVYNIVGQEVAALANGRFSVGYHNFTFDGSGIASGIYFIQAAVPGKMNEIRKVVLMK